MKDALDAARSSPLVASPRFSFPECECPARPGGYWQRVTVIEAQPAVLTLQLMRFEHDGTCGGKLTNKVKFVLQACCRCCSWLLSHCLPAQPIFASQAGVMQVDFPLVLDLAPYKESNGAADNYDLRGLVEHQGSQLKRWPLCGLSDGGHMLEVLQ